MSELRCPSCGGLVAADAEWCGQCLNRLPPRGPEGEAAQVGSRPEAEVVERQLEVPPPAEAPAFEALPAEAPVPGAAELGATPAPSPIPRERPPGDESEDAFRMVDGRMVWTCPVCGLENAMEEVVCPRCGSSFASLFREPTVRPAASTTRVIWMSLIFPGLGHIAAHQLAEGLARGILFLWAVGSLIGIIAVRDGGQSSLGTVFVLTYLMAAAALYVVTAIDAYRATELQPPLAPIRMLFYGASGLMAVTVAVLLFSGFNR
ncbi:MAG TPA: hypothetical protein VGB51_05005 [Actinomycetota bacterium]